jgi:prepilin-type N-terminal cleavage/methylation domain-containing protein
MRITGYTLIELITVMAVLSVIMGVTAVMLVQLFDFQQNTGEHADKIRAADRFVAIFRSDVHTYGKPDIFSEGNVLLRWTTETEIIEYTAQPGEFPDQLNIVRTVQKEEGKHNETYRLPDRTMLRFTEGKDADAGLIALSLWTAPQGTGTLNHAELNPFDRTIPKTLENQINPKFAGNWRTIVVRY